jgi:hypothetical protein
MDPTKCTGLKDNNVLVRRPARYSLHAADSLEKNCMRIWLVICSGRFNHHFSCATKQLVVVLVACCSLL